jgi:hypothetical protein
MVASPRKLALRLAFFEFSTSRSYVFGIGGCEPPISSSCLRISPPHCIGGMECDRFAAAMCQSVSTTLPAASQFTVRLAVPTPGLLAPISALGQTRSSCDIRVTSGFLLIATKQWTSRPLDNAPFLL